MKETEGQFGKAVERLREMMSPCGLCPRKCRVNRNGGEIGFCGTGERPLVSSVGPHFGEESVLVGSGGSGTIFFAGCNLGCVFCQNYDISHKRIGTEAGVEQLAKSMLQLQDYGCVNINLVTPTHVAAACAEAILLARKEGLKLPIVYNTGGYDSVETLKLLKGLVDVYMPDMKYADAPVAKELSDAENYPQVNQSAVKEMHRQVGDLRIENGIATSGLLIRHLVLPDNLAGGFHIIDILAEQISSQTAVNVMDQYRPCFRASEHPGISRRPTQREIQQVYDYAVERGLRIVS